MISKYTSPTNLDEIVKRLNRLAYIGKSNNCECGESLISCTLKHKGKATVNAYICTSCGNVYINSERVHKANVKGEKVCCM